MRKTSLMIAALAGMMAVLPANAPAQVNVSVAIGTRLGPAIGLFAYSSSRYGAWRTAYVRWTPVIVYEYQGRYYPRSVRGARAVAVYRYHDEYFLPPHVKAWAGFDRRFDYRHEPDRDDWKRGRAHDDRGKADHRKAHERGRGNGGGGR